MEVEAADGEVTVLCEALGIQPGEEVRLTGRYTTIPPMGSASRRKWWSG